MDTPLFKKYAVMNSGLIDASRYNDSIIQSIGDAKVKPITFHNGLGLCIIIQVLPLHLGQPPQKPVYKS